MLGKHTAYEIYDNGGMHIGPRRATLLSSDQNGRYAA